MRKKDVFNPLALEYSKHKLKKSFGLSSIDDIYDFTNSFLGKGYYERISMHQYPEEFKAFCREVKSFQPKTIVEIGTKKGGSFFVWARFLKPDTLISIDLPGGIHGGGYPTPKKAFYKSFLDDKKDAKIELIQADSQKQETFERLKSFLNGKSIDFLFIDGDHRYNGVKSDFLMYSKLMKEGGLVGFHDIVSSTYHHNMDCYVDKLWDELKSDFKYREFIANPNQIKYGLGLIYI